MGSVPNSEVLRATLQLKSSGARDGDAQQNHDAPAA
jgi:hypothetical protein